MKILEAFEIDFQRVTDVHILQIKGTEISRIVHFLFSLDNNFHKIISIYITLN